MRMQWLAFSLQTCFRLRIVMVTIPVRVRACVRACVRQTEAQAASSDLRAALVHTDALQGVSRLLTGLSGLWCCIIGRPPAKRLRHDFAWSWYAIVRFSRAVSVTRKIVLWRRLRNRLIYERLWIGVIWTWYDIDHSSVLSLDIAQ